MSTIPTNRESDRFMLRLPDGMRDRIKAAAEENARSMNAEIIARLEASFVPGRGTSYAVPNAAHLLEGIFEYLAAEGWTPPSQEVTDNKTRRILRDRKGTLSSDPE